MSLDSTKTSKIAKTVAIVARGNAAYLMAGATKVPECQMEGKREGQTYDFVVDSITAAEFSDGSALTDGLSSTSVSLKVRNVGYKIESSATQKALCLDDQKKLGEKGGMAIVREATALTLVDDMGKVGCEIISTNNAKAIVKAAAEIAGDYNARVYGFVSSSVMGDILGDKREQQPVSIEGDFVNAKSWNNIDEMYTLALPKNSTGATIATNAVTTASTIGSTVTIASGTAGKWYKFGDAVVVAQSSTVGVVAKAGAIAATTADTDSYYPVVIRCQDAQAWGDASKCLGGAEEIEPADGVSIAHAVVKGDGFKVNDQYGLAMVAGIADKKAAKILLCKV